MPENEMNAIAGDLITAAPKEVKPGWKTTEFYASLAAGAAGLAVTLGLFTPEQAQGVVSGVTQIAGGLLTGLAVLGYGVSRGLAKR
ncbi:MAG: hypothetical protein KQJ78_10955 [Deltaproteobacteria bacterium]|nr:hypothetical protein [Deltaproteobacteria bacterium]